MCGKARNGKVRYLSTLEDVGAAQIKDKGMKK